MRSTIATTRADAVENALMCCGTSLPARNTSGSFTNPAPIATTTQVNPTPVNIFLVFTPRSDVVRTILIAKSSPSGGIAGRMYPGNLDCDTLKKRMGKTAQHAKKNPGDFAQDLSRQSCSPSCATGQSSAVQGSSASKMIGPKYQNGWRC